MMLALIFGYIIVAYIVRNVMAELMNVHWINKLGFSEREALAWTAGLMFPVLPLFFLLYAFLYTVEKRK